MRFKQMPRSSFCQKRSFTRGTRNQGNIKFVHDPPFLPCLAQDSFVFVDDDCFLCRFALPAWLVCFLWFCSPGLAAFHLVDLRCQTSSHSVTCTWFCFPRKLLEQQQQSNNNSLLCGHKIFPRVSASYCICVFLLIICLKNLLNLRVELCSMWHVTWFILGRSARFQICIIRIREKERKRNVAGLLST